MVPYHRVSVHVVLIVIVFLWLLTQFALFWITIFSSSDITLKTPAENINHAKHAVLDSQLSFTPTLTSLWERQNITLPQGPRALQPWTTLWRQGNIHALPDILTTTRDNTTEDEVYNILSLAYLQKEKDIPYTLNGIPKPPGFTTNLSRNGSSNNTASPHTVGLLDEYYNSLAVFPFVDRDHFHGILGFSRTTLEPLYSPNDTSVTHEIPVSDRFGVERKVHDSRHESCIQQTYNRNLMKSASIVIAFRYESFSSILRGLHSILNQTPAPLLMEIILVDAGSTLEQCKAGRLLDQYVRSLPKVKLMRTPQPCTLTAARRFAFHITRAPVVVFLDAHIEVSPNWLEPLLDVLGSNRHAVVFPQIWGIDPRTMALNPNYGAGCSYRLTWNLRAIPEWPLRTYTASDPISSSVFPSEAFAVQRSWLNVVGGFGIGGVHNKDENIELSLRIWNCGGSVVCAPCSVIYHGLDAPVPVDDIVTERTLRGTAYLWLHEFSPLPSIFYNLLSTARNDEMKVSTFYRYVDISKETLNCRTMTWYMDHVAQTLKPKRMEHIQSLGLINPQVALGMCLQTKGIYSGSRIKLLPCQRTHPYQIFMTLNVEKYSKLILVVDPVWCVAHDFVLRECDVLNDLWEPLSLVRVSPTHRTRLRTDMCDSKSMKDSWSLVNVFLQKCKSATLFWIDILTSNPMKNAMENGTHIPLNDVV